MYRKLFSSSSIKRLSKDIFKNNAIILIVSTAIVLAIWFVGIYLALIVETFTATAATIICLCIFSILFFAPIFMGFLRYIWRMISGVTDNPITLFYYFSEKKLYFKVLKLTLSLGIRAAVCYLIFYIPIFVLNIITGTRIYEALNIPVPMWTFNLSNLTAFLRFLSIIATLISVLKLYLAPMLFVADENIDVAEAVHLSNVISKRTIIDFIFLGLSFAGWILLSFLSLPLIFTLPYMIAAYLIHSSAAVDAFNKEISRANYDDIPTFIAGV